MDWEDPDPVMRVRITDTAGQTRLAVDVPLSELRFPR